VTLPPGVPEPAGPRAPQAPSAPGPGTGPGVPWERRAELGLLTALIQTVVETLARPAAFFRRMDPRGSVGAALVYAILVGWASLVVEVVWRELVPFPWPTALDGLAGRTEHGVSLLLALVFVSFLAPILIPLSVFLLALVYHGLLVLFGGPSRGFEATARTVAYSQGAHLLNIIPFCGALIGFGWWIVVMVIGLREVHGTETGKAIAVVVAPALFCAVVAVGMLVFFLLAVPGVLHHLSEMTR
jgi:hypothetical protein